MDKDTAAGPSALTCAGASVGRARSGTSFGRAI